MKIYSRISSIRGTVLFRGLKTGKMTAIMQESSTKVLLYLVDALHINTLLIRKRRVILVVRTFEKFSDEIISCLSENISFPVVTVNQFKNTCQNYNYNTTLTFSTREFSEILEFQQSLNTLFIISTCSGRCSLTCLNKT